MGALGAISAGCQGLRIPGPEFWGPEFWRVIQTVLESENSSPDGMLALEAGEDIE